MAGQRYLSPLRAVAIRALEALRALYSGAGGFGDSAFAGLTLILGAILRTRVPCGLQVADIRTANPALSLATRLDENLSA
jgi:hypothetical protein